MTPSIARIYKRVFATKADAEAFMEAVPVIESRLTAVDVKYRLYHCDDDPLVMFEIWSGCSPQWKVRQQCRADFRLKPKCSPQRSRPPSISRNRPAVRA